MGCDKIPHSVKVSITQTGEVTVHRSAVRSNLGYVENIDYPVWRGGRAVDKFAGSNFGQRSVSGAGPAGVTYREVGHSAPVSGAK